MVNIEFLKIQKIIKKDKIEFLKIQEKIKREFWQKTGLNYFLEFFLKNPGKSKSFIFWNTQKVEKTKFKNLKIQEN